MVKKLNEVYRCAVCGNMVEVVKVGGGELVCCGQPMELLKENSVDASVEKHLPVIESDGGSVKVKIGSEPHPMEEKHYIMWIELLADGISYKEFLEPGQAPEAVFAIAADGKNITARAYCNLHGLWKKE